MGQTPDLKSSKVVDSEDLEGKFQRAEEKVKQAVNLSEIDDTFLNISDKSH